MASGFHTFSTAINTGDSISVKTVGFQVLDFIDSIITEPWNKTRKNILDASANYQPWSSAVANGYIPQWAYDLATGGPNGATNLIGTILYQIGGVEFLFIVAQKSINVGLYLFVRAPQGSPLYLICFEWAYGTATSSYLNAGEVYTCQLCEKFDQYFIFCSMPASLFYTEPYVRGVIRLEKTIAPDDSRAWITLFDRPQNSQISNFMFTQDYNGENVNVFCTLQAERWWTEDSGFVKNYFSNKVPLYPSVGATAQYGRRGSTEYLVFPPASYTITRQEYLIDSKQYMGLVFTTMPSSWPTGALVRLE